MKNMILRSNNGWELNPFYDFDSFFRSTRADRALAMKTDIKELENSYVLEVELPGFDKKDIDVKLENGYLTLSATVNEESDDNKPNYLRHERRYESSSRSYYVGEDIKEDDVNAKYENGILSVEIPKKVPEKVEEKKKIEIK